MNLSAYKDHALLFLRVGMGIMMMTHGIPKLIGGPDKWESIGANMKNLGIDFAPVFWGLMAAISESAGALLVVLGFWFRMACFLIIITMIVAAVTHFERGDGLKGVSHAIENAIVYTGMLLLGPGKFSLRK